MFSQLTITFSLVRFFLNIGFPPCRWKTLDRWISAGLPGKLQLLTTLVVLSMHTLQRTMDLPGEVCCHLESPKVSRKLKDVQLHGYLKWQPFNNNFLFVQVHIEKRCGVAGFLFGKVWFNRFINSFEKKIISILNPNPRFQKGPNNMRTYDFDWTAHQLLTPTCSI